MKRLLRIDVLENLAVADCMTVNCIVIIIPSVHGTVWVAINNVLVHSVEHVFEITDLEICGCSIVRATCEADVHRCSRPQKTLL